MRQAFLAAVRSVITPFRVALLRLVLLTGTRSELRGIKVVDIATGEGAKARAAKLGEALDLLATSAPEDFDRVKSNLDRVVIFTGSGTQYLRDLGACFIDAGYLMRQPAARTAMSLAHEATHAELFRRGVGYGHYERAKVEERCVEAEIRVARKIPGASRLVDEAREQLQNPWWTDEQLFARRVEHLRESGWPTWFTAWYGRIFRPRG